MHLEKRLRGMVFLCAIIILPSSQACAAQQRYQTAWPGTNVNTSSTRLPALTNQFAGNRIVEMEVHEGSPVDGISSNRVTGVVLNLMTLRPVSSVAILDGAKVLAISDKQGRLAYSFDCAPGGLGRPEWGLGVSNLFTMKGRTVRAHGASNSLRSFPGPWTHASAPCGTLISVVILD